MREIPTTFSSPSAQRETHQISRRTAATLWSGVNFAAEIGRPLTTFVTINFSLTDCPLKLTTAKFRLVIEAFTRWWRRPPRRSRLSPPGEFLYVWVAENGSGQPGIHWLLHLPENRRADFAARLPEWLAAVAGDVQPGAIHIEDAYYVPGAREYMLKGCDRAYAENFLKIDFVAQGVIYGKRSGVSRSLQRTARSRGRYRKNRMYRDRVARPEGVALT